MSSEHLLYAEAEPRAFHTLSCLILSIVLRSRCCFYYSHFTNGSSKAQKLKYLFLCCRERQLAVDAPQHPSLLNCIAGSDQTSSITYHHHIPSGSCKHLLVMDQGQEQEASSPTFFTYSTENPEIFPVGWPLQALSHP